jgi:enoyl-CoA hydratase/carnithine racemase
MPDVVTELDGGVLRLQLNRPEKKNALTRAMYTRLSDTLEAADADDSIRVIVLHGAGDAFTSGNDLRDFLEEPPRDQDHPTFRFILAVSRVRTPLVAAVQGSAVGIGTTLLLHCDLVYAAENARFHTPFVDLGLVPELASSLTLPAVAGHQRAAEMLLLGAPIDAQRGVQLGFVNAVVPAERLLETAMQAARAIAAKPAASVRLTKALMRRAQAALVASTIDEEARLFVDRLGSPEAKEAFGAFLEKRRPDFSRFQ